MRRLPSLAAAALAATVLAACAAPAEDAGSDDPGVSADQVDAAAEAGPGDCLPMQAISEDPEEFAVDCSDPAAFWTITAIDGDTAATAAAGDLKDYGPIFDLCGDEVGALEPGEPLTDWNMIYDKVTGEVDYLFCTEALTEPDEEGRVSVVPAAGDCFSSADSHWATLPCDSDLADFTVVDVVELELAEHAEPDLDAAAAECGDAAHFALTDLFNRTSAILCVE